MFLKRLKQCSYPVVALIMLLIPHIASAEMTLLEGKVTYTATNKTSTFDRRTRKIVNTALITVTNTSQEYINTPLHAVISTLITGVEFQEAFGGDGVAPYDKYYYDLSESVPAGLAPQESVSFTMRSISSRGYSFTIEFYGELSVSGVTDSDGDGVEDSNDACDTQDGVLAKDDDNDGCDDTDEDLDDDNDGRLDTVDSCFTIDFHLSSDFDNDGCDDADEDADDDNDGVSDEFDACRTEDFHLEADLDNDGCDDANEDTDDDNDGVQDSVDACYTADFHLSEDADGDGCDDANEDNDIDNDGVLNAVDSCFTADFNLASDFDTDGCDDTDEDKDDDNDGVEDTVDSCVTADFHLAADVDNDGCDDTDEDSDFNNPNDTDLDGVPNDVDSCNTVDGNLSQDFDMDGCDDADEDKDDDNDGVEDIGDACLTADYHLSADADSDGCDDANEDKDDDNDGVEDELDQCAGTAPNVSVNANGCEDDQSDSIAPLVVVNNPLATTSNSGETFTGTATDNKSIDSLFAVSGRYPNLTFELEVVGNNWSLWMPLEVGDNQISIHAVDGDGNETVETFTVVREENRVNADLVILSPSASSTVSSASISVTGNIISEKAANQISVTINGVPAALSPTSDVTVTQFSLQNIGLQEGANVLEVQAIVDYELYTDEILNASVVVNYQPEQEESRAPEITIVKPSSNSYLATSDFYITLNYTSYSGGAHITINGTPVVLANKQYGTISELLNFPAGQESWNVNVEITDSSSKVASQQVTYYLDTTAPVLQLDNAIQPSPVINTVTEQPYTLSGTVADSQIASLTINGSSIALQPTSNAGVYTFSAQLGLSLDSILSVNIEAKDYSGNITATEYSFELDSNVSMSMLLPPANTKLINLGQPINLQVAARLVGVVDNYSAKGVIKQGNNIIAESLLNIGEGLASGYIETPLQAGSYTIEISLLDQGVELTKTTRTISVENNQDVPLQLVNIEPNNGEQHIETNVPITLYFNKAIDPTKLNVEVRETAHGFSYVNSDPYGTEGFQAKGYQLVKVDIDDEPVTGGISVLPGARVIGFYPSREFAYKSTVQVTVTYDGEEYSRSRFNTRELPTFVDGAVLDQFGQPVPGAVVELVELNRQTVSDASGVFGFGYGDKPTESLPDGRFTLRVNSGFKLPDFGTLQKKVFINKGEKTRVGGQVLAALNKDDAFSSLQKNAQVHLAKGDLKLDTTNANVFFADGKTSGFAMALFMPAGSFPHSYDPMFMPYWLYGIHPMGIDVDGEIGIDFALPKLELIQDYVWDDGAYVLLVGLDPEKDIIVPVGVGIVENHRVKSLRAEYSRLDYIGYAPMPEQVFEHMQSYAEQGMSLSMMVTKIRSLLTSVPSGEGNQ